MKEMGGRSTQTTFFPVSEDAIARTFTAAHRNSMKFDHDVGRWFQWTGQRWLRLTVPVVFQLGRELGRTLSKGKRTICKASVAAGAERLAAADPAHAVASDFWDPDPWLLGTPLGTVDLRSGKLRKARPLDAITKLTGCELARGTPSRWLKFLREATGEDQELIDYLQRVVGYCLTGDISEHALFFLHGPGGNGKSVFLNVLVHILGDYAVTAPMETFTSARYTGHPTDLAMLMGSRLVAASETEEGHAWAEARIKQITGGDRITARFMRRDFFTYIPQFKLVFAGNHQPAVQSADPALRRRVNMLPFLHRPETPDRKLEGKLKTEGPEILGWALDGCLAWQRTGLRPPTVVTAATAEYFDEQDTFGQWLRERCKRDPSYWEQTTTLFRDWSSYAREIAEDPGTSVSFATKLKRNGLTRAKRSGYRVFNGLRLRPLGWTADSDVGTGWTG